MRYFLTFIVIFGFSTTIVFPQKITKVISTATSNVSILNQEFIIPNLNDVSHKLWVYVPPNYDNNSKKFPVIYMHDGQNLFDNATSFLGEWEVDETLNNLFNKTGKGFIVVGIENGRDERINEYTPWKHVKYGGGKGALYVDFIINTIKPFIDANYRTKKKQKYTALIGSSLGGLISYYGGLKYPDTFGRIGALSTSFWFSGNVKDFTRDFGNTNKVKLFLLKGGKEDSYGSNDLEIMEDLLLETGFKSRNLKTKINPKGQHNEAFWKSEFLNIIKWLYGIK